MCALDKDLSEVMYGFENDYALSAAQRGIALNFDRFFEDEELKTLLMALKSSKTAAEKAIHLLKLEQIYKSHSYLLTDEQQEVLQKSEGDIP